MLGGGVFQKIVFLGVSNYEGGFIVDFIVVGGGRVPAEFGPKHTMKSLPATSIVEMSQNHLHSCRIG